MLLQSLAASAATSGQASETMVQAPVLPPQPLDAGAFMPSMSSTRQADTAALWSTPLPVPSPGEASAATVSDMAPLIAAPESAASALPLSVPVMVTNLHLQPAVGRRMERDGEPQQVLPMPREAWSENDPGDEDRDDDEGTKGDAPADAADVATHHASDRAAADYRQLVQRLQAEGLQAAWAELQQRRKLLIVMPASRRAPSDRAAQDVTIHLLTAEPRDARQGWVERYRGRGAWPVLASGRNGDETTGLWKRWRLHREQAGDGHGQHGQARLCVTRSPALGAPGACVLSLRLGAAALPPPLGHAQVAWLDVHEPQRLLRDLQGQWSVSLWWRVQR
jgi:hypothetical protein